MPLGTVGGIPIRANWSIAVIFALIAFGLAAWDFPAVNPHQSPLNYVLAGVLTTAVYLASLLAHELAHSLASPQDSVADILPRLTGCADRRLLVFSDGHLSGIITPSDITRMIDRLSLVRSP